MAEDAPNTDALAAEQAARYAGLLKIERGAGAFRVTFPTLSDPDDAIRRAAFREARPILDQVKSIMGRKYDALNKSWIVPLDQASSIEILALDYGATIEDAADDAAAARIAELERQLADLQAAYEDALAHDCAAVLAQVAA